jgi:outer membrane lipoprotein-sorting protein
MRLRLLSTLLALGLVLATAPGPAAASDTGTVLARLRELAAGVETLSSDFRQEKYLAIFRDVLPASGRFYYRRPDCLRWEMTAPIATGFVLCGDRGWRWRDRESRVEDFEIAREPVMKIVADQLLAWTRVDIDRLQREYDIRVENPAPVTLRLTPRGAAADFLDHLLVRFAPSGEHVQQVEVHEKGGDYTRITFYNTRVNVPLADGLF